jgi:phosphoribosylformylglycinamidine synthase
VVVSVAPDRLDTLLDRAREAGVPASVIGTVGGSRLVIRVSGAVVVDVPVGDAEHAWRTGLERYFVRG